MNELQVFSFEQLDVRTLTINCEPWFVGKDIANALGYVNTSDAIKTHIDKEDKLQVAYHDLQNFGLSGIGTKGTQIINESGVYALIFSSELPSAKKFKRWVTNTVLPSLRKYGYYTTQSNINNLEQRIDTLEQRVNTALPPMATYGQDNEPVALFCNACLVDALTHIKGLQVYEAYVHWCCDNKQMIQGRNTFYRILKMRGVMFGGSVKVNGMAHRNVIRYKALSY